MKSKSPGKNQDVTNAEVPVLQSIGENLGQKQTPDFKDEDELFGSLIASQVRQIAPERNVVAKMQIPNIVYQEMLAPFTGGQGCRSCIRHSDINSITASRIEWSGIRTKIHFRFLICWNH